MTLAEVCVKRGVFAVMLIAFLTVLGLFSFRELGVDLFPRADPATVNINVRLPGATPEEMTTQVVLPTYRSHQMFVLTLRSDADIAAVKAQAAR